MKQRFADAVIVAAGLSRRMNGTDKMDAELAGRPLLAWSVEAMSAAESVDRVIVVAPPERLPELSARAWLREAGVTLVGGGAQRSDSVLAGVKESAAEVVLVHDGARPLATPALVDAVAHASAEHGAAIPLVPVADSLKHTVDGRIDGAVDRSGISAAQTPQGARRTLLLAAAEASAGQSFTDEAGLLAANGVEVFAVPGEVANLKVTRPADLELARALAVSRTGVLATRTGFGQDSHQFGRGDGLWLGGLLIAEAPRLHGHSDGDAALHALTTALLSAAGQGDVGRVFPATDPTFEGAASATFVRTAVGRLRNAGLVPSSVTVSVVGARPKLGARRIDEMRDVIANLLGMERGAVSVTASTGNLSGPEGSGRAISATAFVSVARS